MTSNVTRSQLTAEPRSRKPGAWGLSDRSLTTASQVLLVGLLLVGVLLPGVGCNREAESTAAVPDGPPIRGAAIDSEVVVSTDEQAALSHLSHTFDKLVDMDRGPEKVGDQTVPFKGFASISNFVAPVAGMPPDVPEDPWEIPQRVNDLDGTLLAVEGFMVPWQMEGSKVKTFYLTRDLLGCCFGRDPLVNEAIEVAMEAPVNDVAGRSVIVSGILHVNEVRDETGTRVCLYRMTGKKVRDPW